MGRCPSASVLCLLSIQERRDDELLLASVCRWRYMFARYFYMRRCCLQSKSCLGRRRRQPRGAAAGWGGAQVPAIYVTERGAIDGVMLYAQQYKPRANQEAACVQSAPRMNLRVLRNAFLGICCVWWRRGNQSFKEKSAMASMMNPRATKMRKLIRRSAARVCRCPEKANETYPRCLQRPVCAVQRAWHAYVRVSPSPARQNLVEGP